MVRKGHVNVNPTQILSYLRTEIIRYSVGEYTFNRNFILIKKEYLI